MENENIKLEDVTIAQYSKMLRAGQDTEKIDCELQKVLGSKSGSFDVHVFLLQKDLLVFQCKFAISLFDRDEKLKAFYERKIKDLREELNKKTSKKEATGPYRSFLGWVLSVEKFLGFSIDRNNDLLYLCEATKQMLNYYDNQRRQIEEQSSKNRR